MTRITTREELKDALVSCLQMRHEEETGERDYYTPQSFMTPSGELDDSYLDAFFNGFTIAECGGPEAAADMYIDAYGDEILTEKN